MKRGCCDCTLSCLYFVARTNTLALHEKLRKVLRMSVSYSPFPVLNPEGGLLFLALVSVSGCLRLSFLALFADWLFLNLNDFRLSEFFILDFILLNVLLLS